MDQKVQVHVQVAESTKREWRKGAEEHPEVPNGSLSQLIRLAVTRELREDNDPGQTAGAFDDILADDVGTLKEEHGTTQKNITELRDTVSQMDTKLESVHRQVTGKAEKRPLEDRLKERLPPARPKSKMWSRLSHKKGPAAQASVWATAWSGEILDLAERVGEKPDTVEDKLDEMGVPREKIDGEMRYWMEGKV